MKKYFFNWVPFLIVFLIALFECNAFALLKKDEYYRLPMHIEGRDVDLLVKVEDVREKPNKVNQYDLEVIQVEDKSQTLVKKGVNFISQKLFGKEIFSSFGINLIKGVDDSSLLAAMMNHASFKKDGKTQEGKRAQGDSLAIALDPLEAPAPPQPKADLREVVGSLKDLDEEESKIDGRNEYCKPVGDALYLKPKKVTLAQSLQGVDSSARAIETLSLSHQAGFGKTTRLIDYLEGEADSALNYTENKVQEACYEVGVQMREETLELIKQIEQEDLKISAQLVGQLYSSSVDALGALRKIGFNALKEVKLGSLPSMPNVSLPDLPDFKMPELDFKVPTVDLLNLDSLRNMSFSLPNLQKLQIQIDFIVNEIDALGDKVDLKIKLLKLQLTQASKRADKVAKSLSRDEQVIFFHRLKSIAEHAQRIYEVEINTKDLALRLLDKFKNANKNIGGRLKLSCVKGLKYGAISVKGLSLQSQKKITNAATKAAKSVKESFAQGKKLVEKAPEQMRSFRETKDLKRGGKAAADAVEDVLEAARSGKEAAIRSKELFSTIMESMNRM